MVRIKFGLVGCGRMGLRRAKRVIDHPNAELVCVADVDEEKAKKTSKEFGVNYYTDFRELVGIEEIDSVIVCVPNKYHAPVTIEALNNGKHVFCEKPLARTPEEAKMMVEAAKENGVTLKVTSNLRYFPSVQKAKELLNEIGDVLFFRGWIGNSGWQLESWFSNPDMIGGGTLLDNGCHLLDLCIWF